MSFTLNLGFGGLCLFVRDKDKKGNPLAHVLLPDSRHHKPFLAYDEQAEKGLRPTGNPKTISLKKTRIDLSGLRTSTRLQPPPGGVADLSTLCKPVSRYLLDDDLGPALTARTTFAAGESRADYCAQGAFWEFLGERQLAIRVIWSIKVDDADLTVVLQRGSKTEPIQLKPYDGVLDLWVFHLSTSEKLGQLPPLTGISRPDYDREAAHFKELTDLLDCPKAKVPRFRRSELIPGRPRPPCYAGGAPGLDVTCIGATAPAAPRP